MQKIVIIANGAAYGSESLFNSLRLAIALREQASDLDLRLFLMSDAVTAGLRGQKPTEGYNIQQMLEILTAQNVPVNCARPARRARDHDTAADRRRGSRNAGGTGAMDAGRRQSAHLLIPLFRQAC